MSMAATTAARLAGRLGQHDHRADPARQDRVGLWQAGGRDAGDVGRQAGQFSRLRSFDPARVADLEYRAWVGYYQHDWHQALLAFVGLIRMGFGMDWYRTLHGTWLALRAIQLWAPLPDNDPDGARAHAAVLRLVRLSHGELASPAKAAELEVDWWRVHRQVQYSTPGVAADDLVESVTRLYCYLFG